MNDTPTVIVGLLGILTTVGSWFFFSGSWTARVKSIELQRAEDKREQHAQAVEHRAWLEAHDKRLGNHDVELAESRGFREGFRAAAQPK